jgi:hypothetical protein
MSLRLGLALYVLGLVGVMAAAALEPAPGYMDADYYLGGGIRLAQGHGFSEAILWNYLDDPSGLPHPSHGYWMPLPSILAASGMALSGRADFSGGRTGFILLAGLTPMMTAYLAHRLTGRRQDAILAGLLVVAPGFYLPYLATTDTFGMYMLLGTGVLLAGGRARSSDSSGGIACLVVGMLIGLMHLSRVDGLIWLAAGLLAGLQIQPGPIPGRRRVWIDWRACLLIGLGYVLVIAPWILRNLNVFGSALGAGGSKGLWLAYSYDELYSYPAAPLTFQRWLTTGVQPMLTARWNALSNNLQSLAAVQGQIFMLPLSLIGLWDLRRNRMVQAGGVMWLLTFGLMTLVFPYQGGRGGYFHSGAALQPLLWAAAPAGLWKTVDWIGQRRGWQKTEQAKRVLAGFVVGFAVFVMLLVSIPKLIGTGWGNTSAQYARVEAALPGWGAAPDDIVMVNDPPAYFVVSGRPAIVIPFGDPRTALAAAHRSGARYLLLEYNQLSGADDLYAKPGDRPGLRYLGQVEKHQIYRVEGN